MQVTDRLVRLFGRWGLGRGGRSHGFRCDRHLADRTVIQTSGYTPQLGQLYFTRRQSQQEPVCHEKNHLSSLKSVIVPCCELLSSCRQSQGKVSGPRSVPTPRWCGGSPPPGRSCLGWWLQEALRALLCPQRCCTPQSVDLGEMRYEGYSSSLNRLLAFLYCALCLEAGWSSCLTAVRSFTPPPIRSNQSPHAKSSQCHHQSFIFSPANFFSPPPPS